MCYELGVERYYGGQWAISASKHICVSELRAKHRGDVKVRTCFKFEAFRINIGGLVYRAPHHRIINLVPNGAPTSLAIGDDRVECDDGDCCRCRVRAVTRNTRKVRAFT
jgi:hypothetical protein